MRRFVNTFICLCVIISILSTMMGVYSAASSETLPTNEVVVNQTFTYLSDGNSVVITITEDPVASRATTYTKSATKTYSMRNKDGDILWQFSVRGTFRITEGVSAVAINVTHSHSIINDAWHHVSSSSYYNTNKVVGNAEFNRKLLGITVETRECQVILTCDSNGNLT